VDILLLVGVLEHIRDLDDSLQKLWRIIKPGGKFFIAVPDGSQYFKGQDAPFQEFSVEHINYFGPGSLENLMKKNKFSKVDVTQDMIEVNHKTFTPAILSLFKKEMTEDTFFIPDTDSKKNLQSYIELSKKKEKQINEIIEKVSAENGSIIVWGTGAQTLRLLASGSLKDASIAAFVDSNPKYQGKLLNGIPVLSPDFLTAKTEPILISTRAYQNEIEKQIKNILKLNNKVIKLY
jgi:hypothetical protein